MPKHRRSSNNADKEYLLVGRVLDVLDCLARGPLTTPQLAKALGISERTTYRFMGAMLRFKWPVLYHRVHISAPIKWALDHDKFRDRFNHRGRTRRT